MEMISGTHAVGDGTVYQWRAEYSIQGDNIDLHWVTVRDAAHNTHTRLVGSTVVNGAVGGVPGGALQQAIARVIDSHHSEATK